MSDYDLYRNRMTAYGSTIKEGRKSAIINKINSTFVDSPSYFEVLINDNTENIGVHIVDDSSSINTTNQNDKIMVMQSGDILSVGDLIKHNNKNWLCVASELFNDIYYKGKITKCNNTLSYYSYENSILYEIPCIVSSQISLTTTLSTDQNKYLEVLSNEIFVRISDNSNTSSIKVNDKFKLGRYNYEIESLSDIVEPGLLIIKLRFISDEVVLPLFELEILNGENIQVNKNDSLTINAQVKNNGEVVNPTPSITYSSSNETIATINASTGVVNILGIGSVVFTAKLTSDLAVLDTISVEIVEVAVANKTVQISGNTSIIKGYTEDYSCVFKNNGIVYSDTSVFYLTADDGISSTSLAQITTQNGATNTCTISGVGLGYVKLFVRNVDSGVISGGFRIKIENLF